MPTLPCVEELDDERQSYAQVVARAAVEVVRQGEDEGRVIRGIQHCIQQIQSGPENVMLCLLMQLSATQDPMQKMFLLLIKAFCLENDIDMLHVLGEDKMKQLLSGCLSQTAKCRNVDVLPPTPTSPTCADFDPGCIMIKYPKLHTSYEDNLVASYVKENIKSRTDPSVVIPEVTEAGMDTTMGLKLKTKKVKLAPSVQASSQLAASH